MELIAALLALGLYGAGIAKVLKEDPPPKPMDAPNREDVDPDRMVVPNPDEMGRILSKALEPDEEEPLDGQ